MDPTRLPQVPSGPDSETAFVRNHRSRDAPSWHWSPVGFLAVLFTGAEVQPVRKVSAPARREERRELEPVSCVDLR
jgi:hypothetical protein